LAEAKAELGGRVVQESNLKPLSEWKRVSDHRIHMLSSRGNVQTFTNSSMNVDALLEMGCEHIAIATGSKWRTDLLGIYHRFPLETAAKDMMIAPEAILDGQRPKDRVLVYDDDHYYLGSAIAEQLAEEGAEVTIVTPEADLAGWTHNTLEHGHIHTRLRELGVEIICNKAIACIEQGKVTLECVFVGKESALDIDHIVPVTSRSSIDETFSGLIRRQNEWRDHGIKTVTQIGDCLAPGTIAMAVYAGHEFARNLELSPEDAVFFKRENDFEIGRK
jgi:dimethylamine/trimethylamine dehydrogenase